MKENKLDPNIWIPCILIVVIIVGVIACYIDNDIENRLIALEKSDSIIVEAGGKNVEEFHRRINEVDDRIDNVNIIIGKRFEANKKLFEEQLGVQNEIIVSNKGRIEGLQENERNIYRLLNKNSEKLAEHDINIKNNAELTVRHHAFILTMQSQIDKIETDLALMYANANRIDHLDEKINKNSSDIDKMWKTDILTRIEKIEKLHNKCFDCHQKCKEKK